jgi:exodeoxyribonuclease X
VLRVIDLETSGEEPDVDIVEVGWSDIVMSDDPEIFWHDDDFSGRMPYVSSLVNPGRPMSPQAQAVHHISNDDVAGAPKAEEVLARAFDCPSDTFFVAHYAEHEIGLLGQRGFRWIDTWKVAIKLAPKAPSWSLQVLRYRLDLDVDRRFANPAHRAGPDAYVTAALVLRMLTKLTPEEMVEISSRPAFLPRLGFGKHSKDPITDVPAGYLDWILRQRTADGGFEFDKNVVYTAQHELMRRQNERG